MRGKSTYHNRDLSMGRNKGGCYQSEDEDLRVHFEGGWGASKVFVKLIR